MEGRTSLRGEGLFGGGGGGGERAPFRDPPCIKHCLPNIIKEITEQSVTLRLITLRSLILSSAVSILYILWCVVEEMRIG